MFITVERNVILTELFGKLHETVRYEFDGNQTVNDEKISIFRRLCLGFEPMNVISNQFVSH